MGLFFTSGSIHSQLTSYSNVGFLSDPRVGRSQSGYVFLVGGTGISWRSTKQTLTTTPSNHSQICTRSKSRMHMVTTLNRAY